MESRSDHQRFTREDLAESGLAGEQVYSPHTGYSTSPARSEMIRETYRLLAVAVFCAMASCWFASRTLPLIKFLVSTPGLILSLLAINLIPHIARGAMGSSRSTGTVVLALDGLLSGIVLSPLVFVAMLVSGVGEDSPNLVQSAMVITGFVFAGITFYVHTSKANFNWGGGIFAGLFFTAIGLGLVSFLTPGLGALHFVILGAIGLLGLLQLLYGTSKVLNDDEFSDPISGALILFAGLFHTFQVILNLLLSFGRSRD